MTRKQLAKELRSNLSQHDDHQRKQDAINLPDDQLIEKYLNTCQCCEERFLDDDNLNDLIAESESLDDFCKRRDEAHEEDALTEKIQLSALSRGLCPFLVQRALQRVLDSVVAVNFGDKVADQLDVVIQAFLSGIVAAREGHEPSPDTLADRKPMGGVQ